MFFYIRKKNVLSISAPCFTKDREVWHTVLSFWCTTEWEMVSKPHWIGVLFPVLTAQVSHSARRQNAHRSSKFQLCKCVLSACTQTELGKKMEKGVSEDCDINDSLWQWAQSWSSMRGVRVINYFGKPWWLSRVLDRDVEAPSSAVPCVCWDAACPTSL